MTNRVAVNDGVNLIWVAEVDEWRRVLETHGWTAQRYSYGKGRWAWIWKEPNLGQHDHDAEAPRYPYTEACEAYRLPVEWWDHLDDDERETMHEFQIRPDIGRWYWVGPFGPSEE